MALPCVSRLSLCSRTFQLRGISKIFHSYAPHSTPPIPVPRCFRWQNGATQLRKSFTPNNVISRRFRTKQRIQETETVRSPGRNPDSPSLFKPFVFSVGVCGCSFLGAMIWNYEKMRKTFQNLQKGEQRDGQQGRKSNVKTFGFRQHVNGFWTSLTNSQKLVLGIVAANFTVWGLWRVARLQPMMMRYFSSSINHPLPSMVLATFSHISFLHLFVNMYVLWSFASVAANLYGCEQFSAVYLSGGTLASLGSITMHKLLRRPPSVSVGASGAIMALLGIVCVTYPNAQLSIAFVNELFPHSFSADSGMKAIIAFDLLGLALGWRFMDHAGHLGGMIFGILYAKYGQKLIWGKRESIMKQWHNVRGKP